MKLIRNSSAINATDVSINFNINEISSILKETNFEQWFLLETFNSKRLLNRLLNYRIAITSFDFSKKNIFCDFDQCKHYHKMQMEYRQCCATNDCPVRYKIIHCEFVSLVCFF